MTDNRTAPFESFTEIQIKSTGTTINIGLDEKSHVVVLYTTGQVQTQMIAEDKEFNKDWDMVKFSIGSGLLREGFEQHVLDISMFIAAGTRTALQEKGYT